MVRSTRSRIRQNRDRTLPWVGKGAALPTDGFIQLPGWGAGRLSRPRFPTQERRRPCCGPCRLIVELPLNNLALHWLSVDSGGLTSNAFVLYSREHHSGKTREKSPT